MIILIQMMYEIDGGNSSVGRAPDCDSGCRGFEPRFSPQKLGLWTGGHLDPKVLTRNSLRMV
jgi:hypothetical protein